MEVKRIMGGFGVFNESGELVEKFNGKGAKRAAMAYSVDESSPAEPVKAARTVRTDGDQLGRGYKQRGESYRGGVA